MARSCQDGSACFSWSGDSSRAPWPAGPCSPDAAAAFQPDLGYLARPLRCDTCSRPEPSTYVELHHNVGMLILRRVYSTEGDLCRQCLHRAFWGHTLRNVTLGWWGTISFFMTWYYLVSNLLTYLFALHELRGQRPRHASRPQVVAGEEARRLLEPFEHNVRLRLRDGETPEAVGTDLARIHDVELAAAMHFVEQVRASE